jgi:cytochrome c oxidase subunit III
MEAASIAHTAAHDDHHHGPPAANRSSRVDPATLGMLLFIMSEIMIFGAFFTAYFFIRVVHNGHPVPPHWFPMRTIPNGVIHELPVYVAGMNTLILVSSSFTLHWAESCIKKGNRFGFKAGMVTTFLLGATFLFVQLNEYVHIGFSPQDFAQATIFYGLTGLHGAHVFIGLTILAVLTVRSFRGHYSAGAHRGVEVPGIYWHFVDVMWIVVYTSVYVL